jgi:hypothetical protein
MGNTNLCCFNTNTCELYDQCETLKDVLVILKIELKRIHNKVQKLGEEMSLSQKEMILISPVKIKVEYINEESKKFHFFINLQMILLSIKNKIEEVLLPKEYSITFNSYEIEKNKCRTQKILDKQFSKDLMNDIRQTHFSSISEFNTFQYTKSAASSPLKKESRSSQRIQCVINKQIDKDRCIEYLKEFINCESVVNIDYLYELQEKMDRMLFQQKKKSLRI